MLKLRSMSVLPIAVLALSLGCSKDGPKAESPEDDATVSGDPVQDVQPGEDPPMLEEPGTAHRPELTAEECEAQGGQVIGDIGDGAIYQEAYMCPSGTPPTGNIVPSAGTPTAVEGAVCCS